MTMFSDPTLGLLVEVASDFTGSDLTTMLMRAGVYEYGHQESNKQERVRSRLLGAQEAAQHGNADAARALLRFVQVLVERSVRDPNLPPAWLGELRENLLADGYELRWQVSLLPDDDVHYEVVPTDAAPIPLTPEISALEAELADRGYTTALLHYKQAVDNFRKHNYEASNGQLRTALEDLVMNLAKDHAAYVGQGRSGEGAMAIRHLLSTNTLPEGDGGRLLHGLWEVIHTNGPHPGQSTADEARMRMQLVTAEARFLLNHFRL